MIQDEGADPGFTELLTKTFNYGVMSADARYGAFGDDGRAEEQRLISKLSSLGS